MELKSCKDDFAEIAFTDQEARDICALVIWSCEEYIVDGMTLRIADDAALSDEEISSLEQKFLELKNKDSKDINISEDDFHNLKLLITTLSLIGANTMLVNVEEETANIIEDKLGDMHAQIFKGHA